MDKKPDPKELPPPQAKSPREIFESYGNPALMQADPITQAMVAGIRKWALKPTRPDDWYHVFSDAIWRLLKDMYNIRMEVQKQAQAKKEVKANKIILPGEQ